MMHHPNGVEGVAKGTVLKKPGRSSGKHGDLDLTKQSSLIG